MKFLLCFLCALVCFFSPFLFFFVVLECLFLLIRYCIRKHNREKGFVDDFVYVLYFWGEGLSRSFEMIFFFFLNSKNRILSRIVKLCSLSQQKKKKK